jgi:hypothetical protein
MALGTHLFRAAAAAACALAFLSTQVAAAPATMRFQGTISDPAAPALTPQGTAIEWQFAFDDAFNALDFPGLSVSPIWVAPQPITGSATTGTSIGGFDRLELLAVTTPDLVAIENYLLIAWFSSPIDDLTGVSLILDRNLQPFVDPGSNVPSLGLTARSTVFAIATTGTYTLTRQSTVPEPATAWLLLPALALLAMRRHRTRAGA